MSSCTCTRALPMASCAGPGGTGCVPERAHQMRMQFGSGVIPILLILKAVRAYIDICSAKHIEFTREILNTFHLCLGLSKKRTVTGEMKFCDSKTLETTRANFKYENALSLNFDERPSSAAVAEQRYEFVQQQHPGFKCYALNQQKICVYLRRAAQPIMDRVNGGTLDSDGWINVPRRSALYACY